MFERRLKICLGILLSVMSILLLRAFHLQVLTRAAWVQQAEEFKKRSHYLETTRGRILDMKGQELAVDEACIDACVDYRAITRDSSWIRGLARTRAAADADTWKNADRKQREALIEAQIAGVHAQINDMFELLAHETGVPREQIDETCRQIDLRVGMSRRRRQYNRYLEAHESHIDAAQAAWYRRWLIEGGKDGPQVDDYADVESEEVAVHPIVRNIAPEAALRLGLRLPDYPGLSLRPGSTRKYPHGRVACHLLGRVSIVQAEDLQSELFSDDPLREYQFNDLIGRGGLEQLCEPTLRGARGKAYKRSGSQDEIESHPAPGRDVKSTIDVHLQDQIQRLFETMEVPSNKPGHESEFVQVPMHGGAVVIDVPTGAVRALASYPDYDVNTLSETIPALLAMEHEAPLLNRATQAQLYPGSTVKPIVGIGGISQSLPLGNHGVCSTHLGIECTGYVVLNGHPVANGRCWVANMFSESLGGKVAHHPVPFPHRGSHGNRDGFLTFAEALERSCNVYFETVALGFGGEGLSYWFRQFGLGRETGLGIAEGRGLLPDQLERYNIADVYLSGMGQVGVTATPIQMANVAATIARDGVWIRPHLVESGYTLNPIRPRHGETIPERVELKVSKDALAAAREGMVRVVNGRAGTGSSARLSEVTVAGKTGTAQGGAKIMDVVLDDQGNPRLDKDGKVQKVARVPASADRATSRPWYRGFGENGDKLNHAWFIGFAPAEDPQVAFAVMVQYGGPGGATAGRAARKLLEACMEHGHLKPSRR